MSFTTSSIPTNPPCIISTAKLTGAEMGHRSHPLDPSRIRFQLPIGDQTGLTRPVFIFATYHRMRLVQSFTGIRMRTNGSTSSMQLTIASSSYVKEITRRLLKSRSHREIFSDFLQTPRERMHSGVVVERWYISLAEVEKISMFPTTPRSDVGGSQIAMEQIGS